MSVTPVSRTVSRSEHPSTVDRAAHSLAFGFVVAAMATAGGLPRVALAAPITVSPHADEFVTMVGQTSGGTLSYIPSYGDGTFGAATVMVDLGYRAGSGIGDFDGDGDLDIVAGATEDDDHGLANFYLFENTGCGVFEQIDIELDVPAGIIDSAISSLAVADYNEDGLLDFVAPVYRSSLVYLFTNDGAGGFTRSTLPAVEDPIEAEQGDFNGDGHIDLVLSEYFLAQAVLYEGDGLGGFTRKTEIPVGTERIINASAGDFDEDGNLDLLLGAVNFIDEEAGIMLYLGDGAGGFTFKELIEDNEPDYWVDSYDFDGDGHRDMIEVDHMASSADVGNVYLRRGNGDGTFAPQELVGAGQLGVDDPTGVTFGHLPVTPSAQPAVLSDPCGCPPAVVMTGTCPGPVTMEMSGFTPGGTIAVIKGDGPGSAAFPGGPCAGDPTGLSGVSLVTTFSADVCGDKIVMPSLPGGACSTWLQMLDVSTCTLSPAKEIP